MSVKIHFKRQPDFNDPSKQLETIPPPEVEIDKTLVPVPANDGPSSDDHDAVDDYEVGYGKPPTEHQFKKGNAGGPGRPKRSKNRKTMFLEEADRYLLNKVDGVRLTKSRAGLRQLATKYAKGDLKAIELSEKMRDKRAYQHAKLIIAFPRHQITFHNFGQLCPSLFERRQMAIILTVQPDAHERRHAEPKSVRI